MAQATSDNVHHLGIAPRPTAFERPIFMDHFGRRTRFGSTDELATAVAEVEAQRGARTDETFDRVRERAWSDLPVLARLHFILADTAGDMLTGPVRAITDRRRLHEQYRRGAKIDLRHVDGFRSDGPPSLNWRQRRRERGARYSRADLTFAGILFLIAVAGLAVAMLLPDAAVQG